MNQDSDSPSLLPGLVMSSSPDSDSKKDSVSTQTFLQDWDLSPQQLDFMHPSDGFESNLV